MKQLKKVSFPLDRVYQLLEPGPVIMVTTSRNGVPNVMTMSWHMMVDFTPPLVACVMGQEDYSFEALKATKECVINIPTADLADKVVGVGNTTGETIDKFKKFQLTPVAASQVQPPLIAECYASLECKVVNMTLVQPYNIFILEVIQAWVAPAKHRRRMLHHCGHGVFVIDGKVITLPSPHTM